MSIFSPDPLIFFAYFPFVLSVTFSYLQERVMKVLQVWADWFLFSDAYVNGLRSTFLRSSNSGVTSFHSISGDATETEHISNYSETGDSGKINPDAALAIGKK
jgi:U2-associated protein SR140